MHICEETFNPAELYSFCNCGNSLTGITTRYQMAKNHYNNKFITSTDFETKQFKQNHAWQLREALLLTPTPLRFDNNFCLIVL
jgi:hypothetical protein